MEDQERKPGVLGRQITRRDAMKAGGIAAVGLAFSQPIISTMRPKPAFAHVGCGGGSLCNRSQPVPNEYFDFYMCINTGPGVDYETAKATAFGNLKSSVEHFFHSLLGKICAGADDCSSQNGCKCDLINLDYQAEGSSKNRWQLRAIPIDNPAPFIIRTSDAGHDCTSGEEWFVRVKATSMDCRCQARSSITGGPV